MSDARLAAEAEAWRQLLHDVLVAVGRHPPADLTLRGAEDIVLRIKADRSARRRIATRAVRLGEHAWLTVWVDRQCVGRLVLGFEQLADVEARLCDDAAQP